MWCAVLADAANIIVDGGYLITAATALGGTIGGGIVGAARIVVSYLRDKDGAHEKLTNAVIEHLQASTEALTRLSERVEQVDRRVQGCPVRSRQESESNHGSEQLPIGIRAPTRDH